MSICLHPQPGKKLRLLSLGVHLGHPVPRGLERALVKPAAWAPAASSMVRPLGSRSPVMSVWRPGTGHTGEGILVRDLAVPARTSPLSHTQLPRLSVQYQKPPPGHGPRGPGIFIPGRGVGLGGTTGRPKAPLFLDHPPHPSTHPRA